LQPKFDREDGCFEEELSTNGTTSTKTGEAIEDPQKMSLEFCVAFGLATILFSYNYDMN
jgi:hypothetical protein